MTPWARRAVAGLLTVTGLSSLLYLAVSTYVAFALGYEAPKPLERTPASLGLTYADVTFPSRDDQVRLRGWFIPGVLPNGKLTADRAIITVHGTRATREDRGSHLFELSDQLVRQGFAVLSFDMRGMGESPPAPISFGYFEQRDVLGAVDFLRIGRLPFPELGRPRIIGGLGISIGAATLVLAAAREPAINAVVSDSAYADIAPLLEREIPLHGSPSRAFTPGAFVMARVLYGIDYSSVRPIDVVRQISPRPLLLIHGGDDDYVPVANFQQLVAAESAWPAGQAGSWLIPKAGHGQGFKVMGSVYVKRVTSFFDATLGADRNSPPVAA